MKKSIFLFICLSITFIVKAQKKKISFVTISGKIVEAVTNRPLEYATVILTHLKNKKISGGITDLKGNFSIKIPKGTYKVKIEFIGYKTKTIKKKEFTKNTHLSTIKLFESAETLDEINIVAEKSTVDIRLDKKIYNVGKDMTIKGGNASDVLDNVPSVNVDAEGNVSLRGNENIRILINGKPSALTGLSGTDALSQLPADAIEKIEVITSPSARYDAEGTAGILNIILRKGKVIGFNSSINAFIGNPNLYALSTAINYRTKKINLFTNTGYRYRNSPGNFKENNAYFNNGNINNFLSEVRKYNRLNKGFNTNVGLEYFIDKNSSVIGSVFYKNYDGNTILTNTINKFDKNRTKTETRNRIQKETKPNKTIQYSLNYTNRLDDNGQKLTIDAQYSDSKEKKIATINETTIFPSTIKKFPEKTSTDKNSKNTILKLDYVLPFGKNAQFEAGYKGDLQSLTSNYLVENFDGINYINNTNFSNILNFEQNIHAFYLQYGKKYTKFSYLLGLRTEITNADIKLINTNESFKKNYTKPVVHFK